MKNLKTNSKRIWMETFLVVTIVGASAQFFSEKLEPKQLLANSCITTSSCSHGENSSLENCCCNRELK
jgi:hypothetical protein